MKRSLPNPLGPVCLEETGTDLIVTNVCNMARTAGTLELLRHLGRRVCPALLSPAQPSCSPAHRYNEALLEEGKMMHRLRHDRVVKLLGIIIEEGNYSLVMEYMEQGNLMHVLKTKVGGT